MENVQDVLNQMTVYNVHLIILIDIHGMEITCRIIETIRILKKVPILVISSIKKEKRATYIESGADMVVERNYNEEDMKLQLFALMRRYSEWEALSPERVYTFNQIYQVVWKDYPQGDIVNMIRCMHFKINTDI